MTLIVEFMCRTQDRPIAKFNFGASNFGYKILSELPNEDEQIIEMVWLDLEEGDAIMSDKPFIERIWYSAVKYEYIPEGFRISLIYVDFLKIS